MTTTIVMPVSRPDHLDAIFARLELMTCKRTETNLLVVVDGPPDLFVKTRNYVEMSKFNQRLCVQYENKEKKKNTDYYARRFRIADIHNLIKQHVPRCDYVFGLEDDTIFPTNALEVLLKNYAVYPYAGIIIGVQLGRWGIPCVGAWKADDVYEPTKITSVMPEKGVTEIDAGGFYCFVTKRDSYVAHTFKPFENGFGPDVDYGIELRRKGQLNYINWDIRTIHKTKSGDISLLTHTPSQVTFTKKESRWRQTQ